MNWQVVALQGSITLEVEVGSGGYSKEEPQRSLVWSHPHERQLLLESLPGGEG